MGPLGSRYTHGNRNRLVLFSHYSHPPNDRQSKVTGDGVWFDGNDAKLGVGLISHLHRDDQRSSLRQLAGRLSS